MYIFICLSVRPPVSVCNDARRSDSSLTNHHNTRTLVHHSLLRSVNQINFVNFSQYQFGWNVAQSSASLCLIFIFTAIFPRLLLPLLGVRKAIQCVHQHFIERRREGGGWREPSPSTSPLHNTHTHTHTHTSLHAPRLCSLLFAGGFFLLGAAKHTAVVLLSLVVIAAGSVSLPATLALLTNQVRCAHPIQPHTHTHTHSHACMPQALSSIRAKRGPTPNTHRTREEEIEREDFAPFPLPNPFAAPD
jgi:hypothetical protein